MSRRGRLWCAIVVSLWLVGIVPSVVWNHDIPAHGPRSYAWWLVLIPAAVAFICCSGYFVVMFYLWAFEREPIADVEARIAQLERDVLGDLPSARNPFTSAEVRR